MEKEDRDTIRHISETLDWRVGVHTLRLAAVQVTSLTHEG
jgi:hypothetical protein